MGIAPARRQRPSVAMSTAAPRALPENTGLAYLGERVARASAIPPRMAERMLATANRHGKPNSDVIRRLVTAADPRHPDFHWQIDFPPTMDEREASLYDLPFHHLFRTLKPTRQGWWINPYASDRLRSALARRERFLATPIGAEPPGFLWFESSIIPDDTLLAVARDDDFTHGVLQSQAFALWWRSFHSRRAPLLAVESFPFPWPPATGLSGLTAAQEEHRHAVARAARGRDAEGLNAAVVAAYGWPADLADADLLDRLIDLNRTRAA